MQLNGDGWWMRVGFLRRTMIAARMDEAPSLLVVHNISLPPGEFGGPWIDALFTGTLDPSAHPFFAEIAHRAFQRIVLFAAMVKLCSMFLLISERGTRAYPAITGVNAAMTFLSALSWKEPTRWLIPMRSTSSWWR